MVRTYKRKTNRQKWDEADMRRAVSAVLLNKMGFLRASATYTVPKSTLERRVKKARQSQNADTDSDNDYGKKGLGHFKPVFTKEQEEELATYVKMMQSRLFGITGTELRILAFQLAIKNNIENPFNREDGMAGKDWLSGFLKRHPDISYRQPEPTSAARAMGFNRVAVNSFFDLLESVVDKHALTADRMYNVDETGISTVPKSQSKILSLKGQKQVGCLTSGERGQLVTAEICFSATGVYLPPMLIYARKRMKNELLDGAPAGFWGTCSDNGWITCPIFFDWFKRFVDFTKPSKDKPVLLMLDGHVSHTKNLDLIDYARENSVILLCTPPHCTHRIQPLDVSFMRPLSTYYSNEVKKWLRDHPGRVVTSYQVADLFGKAFIQASTMSTAINGFKKCGIWPVDRNVFTEADFIAAETTNTETLVIEGLNTQNAGDVPTPYCEPSSSGISQAAQLNPPVSNPNNLYEHAMPTNSSVSASMASQNSPERQISQAVQLNVSILNLDENISEPIIPVVQDNLNQQAMSSSMVSVSTQPFEPLASTSRAKDKTPERQILKEKSSFTVTPENIMAIPKELRTKERQKRKRGKTAILTDSPYKNDLTKENNAKESKENKKKTAPKKKNDQRKIFKPNNKKKAKKQKQREVTFTSSSEEDEDDCACIYCGYLYSQSNEGWVACSSCAGWAHNSCAGVDEDDDEAHICAQCLPD